MPPFETVSARVLEGMVVVVPSFSECQECDDWVIHGYVSGLELLIAPNMTHGVDTPGNMPRDDSTESVAPAHGWKTSQQVQEDRLGDCDIQVVVFEEQVKVIFLEICYVGRIE